MSLLADSLKGLASISLQTETEQTFAKEIVRPFMEQVNNLNDLLVFSSLIVCIILVNSKSSPTIIRHFASIR